MKQSVMTRLWDRGDGKNLRATQREELDVSTFQSSLKLVSGLEVHVADLVGHGVIEALRLRLAPAGLIGYYIVSFVTHVLPFFVLSRGLKRRKTSLVTNYYRREKEKKEGTFV